MAAKRKLSKVTQIAHNKKALIKALEESLGIVTAACLAVGLSRSTFYNYYRSDKKFQASVDDVEEIAIDFVETQLLSQIRENNPTSTIFYLKSKAKHRGYSEVIRNEHSGINGTPIETVNTNISDDDAVRTYMDMIKNRSV